MPPCREMVISRRPRADSQLAAGAFWALGRFMGYCTSSRGGRAFRGIVFSLSSALCSALFTGSVASVAGRCLTEVTEVISRSLRPDMILGFVFTETLP